MGSPRGDPPGGFPLVALCGEGPVVVLAAPMLRWTTWSSFRSLQLKDDAAAACSDGENLVICRSSSASSKIYQD